MEIIGGERLECIPKLLLFLRLAGCLSLPPNPLQLSSRSGLRSTMPTFTEFAFPGFSPGGTISGVIGGLLIAGYAAHRMDEPVAFIAAIPIGGGVGGVLGNKIGHWFANR